MAPRVGRARIVVKEAEHYRLPGGAMARSATIVSFMEGHCMAPPLWKPPLRALAPDLPDGGMLLQGGRVRRCR